MFDVSHHDGVLTLRFAQCGDLPGDSRTGGFFDHAARAKGHALDAAPNAVVLTVDYEGLIEAFGNVAHPETLRTQQVIREALRRSGEGQGSGLEINFHQNPFDTPGRQWDFVLNQGWFTEWVFNRIAWTLAPRHRIATPFPLHVDLETASTCNMNCPMCYRDMLGSSGQMEPALFRSLVDECQRHGVFSIRLSWRGELLTHPNIHEMIAYATARIPNVSFLTNAFYLDDATAECLVDSGLAYVAVSFDGVLDVYEAVRAPAKFQESREKVARLKRLREERGASRPQIRLCTVWPAVSRDPEQYQRLMTPVCDYMVCNPYINFKGERRIKPDFICQYPWERIVVGYDGKAQCCTGWEAGDIILGQGGRDSIASMWNGPLLEAIRAKHAAGERMSIGSCAECRHGAQGDPDASIQEIVRRKY